MKRLLQAGLLAAALLAPACVLAQSYCVTDIRGTQVCGTRPGQCVLDRFNIAWCGPLNGSALKDRYGDAVCAPGTCIADARGGEPSCAAKDGGFVSMDTGGKAVCEGGCTPPVKTACRRASPN